MLRDIKRKSNIATLLGFVALVAALNLPDSLRAPVGGVPALPVALVLAGEALFAYGCWQYARSKGRPGAWGLVVPAGFALIAFCWFYVGPYQQALKWAGIAISVIGLFILAFLPDEHPWGK